MRAATSVPPPAAKPTTMRTGFAGYAGACAWITAALHAQTIAAKPCVNRAFISLLPRSGGAADGRRSSRRFHADRSICVRCGRSCSASAAKHDRHCEDAHSVDQVIGEQRVDELGTALGDEVRAVFLLQALHVGDVAQEH